MFRFVSGSSICLSSLRFLITENTTIIECVKPTLFASTGELIVRYAGHSHWQNIQSTKGKADVIKGQRFLLVVRMMEKAIKGGGSLDPKVNDALRKAIESGKAVNMPKETIERTLARLEKLRKNPIRLKILYRSRAGIYLLVIAGTEDRGRTTFDVGKIVGKFGFAKQTTDPLAPFYTKGKILAKPPPGIDNVADKSLEDAIEVEAEEVTPDEEEPELLRFTCGSGIELEKVKTKLQSRNYTIEDAQEIYVPRGPLDVDKSEQEQVNEMIQEIENNVTDVSGCFVNVNFR